MNRVRILGVTAVALAIVFSPACLRRTLKPLNPCTVRGVVEEVQVANVDKVDLLMMVDNSNSMTEEQESLERELPRLFEILASGDGGLDNDTGTPASVANNFPPVKSLNVGLITSDMGTGGWVVFTCDEPGFGDDGILQQESNNTGCNATYPKFFNYTPASATQTAAEFGHDVACVARFGVGGCGFEQQLESVLKAVTPSTSEILFNQNTRGHADTDNCTSSGCFLRPDSLLAILMVTDEEDCSARDTEIFNPNTSVYPGMPNVRCYTYSPPRVTEQNTPLHPISRYVDGLLATRDNPNLLVLGLITGIPTHLSGSDYDTILNDPAMVERIDDGDPSRLEPSCDDPDRGIAFPPRRIVETAKELAANGANASVHSICQDSFESALDDIIDKIADVLGGSCLPDALNRDAAGQVKCDVVEVLPTDGEFIHCTDIPGRGDGPVRMQDGQEVCAVTQLVASGGTPPTEPGWYYDDFSADVIEHCSGGQRISFTTGNEPKTGTVVRLECLQPVDTGSETVLDTGNSCEGSADLNGDGTADAEYDFDANEPCAATGTFTCARNLVCEGATNTLLVSCMSDADCTGEGLISFVCAPTDVEGDGTAEFSFSVCVNPTCSQ